MKCLGILIPESEHLDSQGYRRQDVVWGGVDIKTGLYTNYVYKPVNMLTGRLMITAE